MYMTLQNNSSSNHELVKVEGEMSNMIELNMSSLPMWVIDKSGMTISKVGELLQVTTLA